MRLAVRVRLGVGQLQALAVLVGCGAVLSFGVGVSAGSGSSAGWSSVPVSSPPGGIPVNKLFSVGAMACGSDVSCVLGGYLATSSYSAASKQTLYSYKPLLWAWNGHGWGYKASSVSGSAALVGSACSSASDCWVVGARFSGQTPSALLEHWNGTSYAPAAGPAPATGIALNGVACVMASSCFAVGNMETSSTAAHGVVEQWNGKTWSPMSAPSPKGALWSGLSSVTCFPAGHCVAVGDAQNSSTSSGYFFGETFNGKTWALTSATSPRKFDLGNETGLYSMGCLTASRCLAVGAALGYTPPGSAGGANFPGGVVERWNGSSWKPVALPVSTGMTPNLPDGVACPSTSSCWVAFAAGPPIGPASVPITLEKWNGSALTPETLSGHGSLDAVSCLTDGWCIAFGQGPGKTPSSPLTLIAEKTS